MGKKTTSAADKGAYKRYKDNDTWLKNRIKKLTKQVKNAPNDKCSANTLEKAKKVGLRYRRNGVG